MCGLSLCCGTIANLSRDEIQQVVDFYRTKDGRVQYKEFCHMMENGEFVCHKKEHGNLLAMPTVEPCSREKEEPVPVQRGWSTS